METLNVNDLLNGRKKQTILRDNYALAEVVKNVAGLKSPRFVSFIYENEYEVSSVTVLVGMNLLNAYRRDLASVEELKNHETNELRLLVINEIADSLSESITKGIGNNSAYTCKDVYTHVAGNNASVKVKTGGTSETGMVYLTGTVIRKRVLAYKQARKQVKSADKTIMKNQIKKDYCKLSAFRQYKLDASSLTSIAVSHNRVIFNATKYNKLAKLVAKRKQALTIEEYALYNMEGN